VTFCVEREGSLGKARKNGSSALLAWDRPASEEEELLKGGGSKDLRLQKISIGKGAREGTFLEDASSTGGVR